MSEKILVLKDEELKMVENSMNLLMDEIEDLGGGGEEEWKRGDDILVKIHKALNYKK